MTTSVMLHTRAEEGEEEAILSFFSSGRRPNMCQLWMWVKARREFMVTEKFPSPVFFRTECFFLGGNGCGGRAGTFGPRDRRLLLGLFDSGARGAPPSFPGRRRRRERCERGRERKRHSARLRKMNDIRVCGGSRVDLSNTFVGVDQFC